MTKFDSKIDLIHELTKRNRIPRFIALFIGCFVVALIYNAYSVPNGIVHGGLSGLAIVINKHFGIGIRTFYNIVTIISIVISLKLLGFKKTSYGLVGYLVYTICINITAPLAKYVTFSFDSFLFSTICYAVVYGIGSGLIYRAGFNTAGMDIFILIFQKFIKLPLVTFSNTINAIIIILGALTFGVGTSIYAIIFLFTYNFFSNFVLLGSKTSKICWISSHDQDSVEKYLADDMKVGYNIMDSTNGVGKLKRRVIMCVVPIDRFLDLKKELIRIDKHAKMISSDCYTVEGGTTNNLIPF